VGRLDINPQVPNRIVVEAGAPPQRKGGRIVLARDRPNGGALWLSNSRSPSHLLPV